jgi:predicted PurR-regulated permease PerM
LWPPLREPPAAASAPTQESHPPEPWWLTRPGRAGLGVLALFASAWALHLAQPFLLPLVVACLIAIVLAPLVRLLRRLRLPAPLAAGFVVLAFATATGAGVYALADPAIAWIERAPGTLREMERRLHAVKESVVEAKMAADTVEKIARVDGDPPRAGDPPKVEVTLKPTSLAAQIVDHTSAFLLGALEVVVLLYFLLAFGGAFLRRLVRVPAGLRSKVRVVQVAAAIERDVSRYLLTVSAINAGLGIATAVTMWLLGMPNPFLWGAVAAILNFVPYLGSAFTLLVLTVTAVLAFDTLARALLAPAIFLALATIEGQVVTPIVLGRSMALSPPAIALALLAGAWIWGVVGLLIAVPVLAMARIYCAHDESLEPLALLLGRD